MATVQEHRVAPGQLAQWPDRLTPSLEARVGPVELRDGLPTPKGTLGRRLGQIASDQAVRRMLRPAPQAGLR